jgi:hypothetical protein
MRAHPGERKRGSRQSCAGDDGEIDAADFVVIAVNASMIRTALAA